MAEQVANSAASTLNGGIDNVVTSLTVVNGSVFPSSGNFRIIIDSEIMICTARATNVLTVQRGQEATAAASHSNGAAVTHILTAGGLLAYTQDPTHLGTGTPTAAKLLRGDGVWAAIPTLLGVQVFTSSGTYTPTSGTTRIYVECVGGGGGGGGNPNVASNSAGGGGGGGAYAAKFISSGFSGVSYAIGAAGSAASNAAGGAGGDTTFNSTVVVAKGGSGGAVGVGNTVVAGGGGGAATGSTGDIKSDGSRGQPGVGTSGQAYFAFSAGGNSVFGCGGQHSGAVTEAGVVGGPYGAGGAGSVAATSGGAQAGGAGATGVIRIWEFL